MTDEAGALVEVVVDDEVCIGIGACVAVEPQVFELRDDGVAHVRPRHGLPRAWAEQVCQGCPSGALRIAGDARTK